MRELLERINGVIARLAALLSTGVIAAPAHQTQARYQAPAFLHLDVTASLEYPAEIQNGDTFQVYVRIRNNSARFILAPKPSHVLIRSDTGLIYRSDFSHLHCLLARSRMIAPGGDALVHIGHVHTNNAGLAESQSGYGGTRLYGYTAEQQLYAIDVKGILPVIIKPSPGVPGLGIPARRQALAE